MSYVQGLKCKECGTEISDKAAACVKCGAPVAKAVIAAPAKKSQFGCGSVIGTLGLLTLMIFVWMGATGDKTGTSAPAAAKTQCAKDDLQCLGDLGVSYASAYCKDDIEHLATHSVKWTDGTFESKFSRFRWKDKPAGTITYIGDKAEFQNGFGAFNPVNYECDLAKDNKTVIDVRVSEGRLPVSH